jgi:3-oxoadipate enol-lactonase
MEGGGLNYREWGSGVSVVLVHGFPFDGAIWEATLARLSDVARVLAPDLPGFGGSAAGDGQASMESYAEALAGWLEGLGLDRVVLAGHSMGGYVAFAFARKYPHLLKGFLPVCTRPGPDSDTAREGRYKQAEAVAEEGPQAVVDAMLPRLFSPDSYDTKPDLVEQVKHVMLRQSPDSIRAALFAMASRPDSTPFLPSIEVPCLVISGADDAIIPAGEAEALLRHLRGAEGAVIPASGHMPMLENPAEFDDALRQFLAGIGA